MTVTNTGRRIALLGVLALMFALVPLSASALTGDIALDYEINPDVDASDAVQTSALVAQNFDAAENVLIATSADFADALASGSLQGADSPLFYTDGDTVDQVVLDEIERLGATGATILGGTAAVSEDVETALTDAGLEVDRLEGQTRIETAIAIAGAADAPGGIFLARAFGADDGSDPTQAFADSLAAGGWSASNGWPILLTQTDVLTGNTSDYLASVEGVDTVTVIGGNAAVSDEVAAEVEALGFTVERIEHETEDNRFGTAVAIAEARGFASADDAETVIFAEGQSEVAFIDGFAAASLSAAVEAPILLTNGETVPPATQAWIGDAGTFEGLLVPSEDIAAHLLPLVENEEGLADALGLDLVLHMLEEEGPTDETSGTLTSIDPTAVTDGGSYTFTTASGAEVTVTYSDDDTFTVDGEAASVGVFEADATPGDMVTFTEGATEADDDTHALVNVEPSSVNEGTVANVNTTADTFVIIEPVSGAVISNSKSYAGNAIFQIDGTPSTLASFENDINEGDSIVITADSPAPGTTTFALMNEAVSGVVADATPGAATSSFQVGPLGDEAANANDTHFLAEAVPGVGTEEYIVDGEAVDYAEFQAELSNGDDVTYTREGNEETFQLGNQAPTTLTGTGAFQVAGGGPTALGGAGGTIEYLPAGSGTTSDFTYSDTADFLVDGQLVTEGQFETAYNEGDTVSYRAGDTITNTSERVTLTNGILEGTVAEAADDIAVDVDRDSAAGTALVYENLDTSDATPGNFEGVNAARYFVDDDENGTIEADEEVTQVDFATAIEAVVDADGGVLTITPGALNVEYRLFPAGLAAA